MKTTHVKIHIDPIGYKSTIELDGKDISDKIDGIWIESQAQDVSRVTIRYVAVDAEVEGDAAIDEPE